MLDYARLGTPREHGEVLVEPAAELLSALVESNRRLISTYRGSFAGVEWQELRNELRRRLVGDEALPLIVCGHQPDFIHPGVWAKHVMASRLAARLGGTAMNLAADNDAPKRTEVSVPVQEGGHARVRTIRYAEAPRDVAYEFIPTADREQRNRFGQAFREALGPRIEQTLMNEFLTALEGTPHTRDWVEQFIHARQTVERGLGITLLERRISRVWYGPMLSALLADAGRFAQAYNGALAEYRKREGIRSSQHPIPDLRVGEGEWELPIWAYQPGKARRRLFVRSRATGVDLLANEQIIGTATAHELADWERADSVLSSLDGFVLRPRALTLTLWARLLLGDLFIQGIGGAKYDRITDALIADYYGLKPPEMACVTATLRLPLPMHDVTSETEHRLQHRLRDVQYNPARNLPASDRLTWLQTQKQSALVELATLNGRDRTLRGLRRGLFLRIREINESMLELEEGVRPRLQAELDRVRRALQENAVAGGREYFFLLYARSDLELLLNRLPQVS